jgi:two-component system response regulator YesN
MYSILLVDDEKSIREHLTKAIPFEEYGFAVKSTALNGKEALEKLPAVRPDLILLDVRMPVMDGLEFLKLLRRSDCSNTQVVMLSGYNEFEYAKEAMKYGVRAYLNKPVDDEELIPLLDSLRKELDNNREEKDRRDFREKMSLFHKLYNGASINRSTFMGYSIMTCVLMKYTGSKETLNIQTVVQECVASLLGDTGNMPFRVKGSQYFFLLQPKTLDFYERNMMNLARKLTEALKAFQLDCAILFDSYVFNNSNDSFREDLLNHNFEMLTELFFSGGRCADYQPERYKAGEERWLPESKYLEELTQCIGTLDKKKALQVVEELTDKVQKEHIGIQYIQEINYRIYYLFTDEMMRFSKSKQPESVIPRPNWLESPYFVTFSEWTELLCSMIKDIFIYLEQNYRAANTGIYTEVVDYVRSHYTEQINLKKVAEKYFINASYLGRIFQKIVGVPFNEYINQLRIEEAKRLLLQTDKLIYEIANQVGFIESSYFVVKFTQEVGKSPTEYRNEKLL